MASVPVSGLEALYYIKKAYIKKNDKVLINGAGGSIGTFAIQLAKYYGAEVTAVDTGEKLESMRSIGADYALDYTKTDYLKSNKSYDVIFDIVGKSSLTSSFKALNKGGSLLISSPRFNSLFFGKLLAKLYGRKAVVGAPSRDAEDLALLAKLIKEKTNHISNR